MILTTADGIQFEIFYSDISEVRGTPNGSHVVARTGERFDCRERSEDVTAEMIKEKFGGVIYAGQKV